MTTRTQLAYAAAGVVLLLGLLSLFNPVVATRLLGLEIAAPRGLSEMRAIYGALFVTMGALLLWALPQRPRGAIVVRSMGILWAGAAVGRAASMAIDDGTLTVGNVASLALATVVAVLLVWGGFETPPTAAEAAARRTAVAARREAAAARRAAGRAEREASGAQRGAAARARLAQREGDGDA
ncbi:MAG: DUF4345 family protein [Trueperaceae bacterium]